MSPPRDDSDENDGGGTDETRPAEFDAPTESGDEGEGEPPLEATETARASGTRRDDSPESTTESLRRTFDSVLPAASIDSKWWYWIAAVPLYLLVGLVGGAIAAVAFLFAGFLDIAGFSGFASLSTFILFAGGAALFGLVGVVVAVLFPVAMYVDARAVEEADVEWRPDPVLWGLFAVVAVLVTNFVVSVPLSLYYLYKRHEAVGTP